MNSLVCGNGGQQSRESLVEPVLKQHLSAFGRNGDRCLLAVIVHRVRLRTVAVIVENVGHVFVSDDVVLKTKPDERHEFNNFVQQTHLASVSLVVE